MQIKCNLVATAKRALSALRARPLQIFAQGKVMRLQHRKLLRHPTSRYFSGMRSQASAGAEAPPSAFTYPRTTHRCVAHSHPLRPREPTPPYEQTPQRDSLERRSAQHRSPVSKAMSDPGLAALLLQPDAHRSPPQAASEASQSVPSPEHPPHTHSCGSSSSRSTPNRPPQADASPLRDEPPALPKAHTETRTLHAGAPVSRIRPCLAETPRSTGQADGPEPNSRGSQRSTSDHPPPSAAASPDPSADATETAFAALARKSSSGPSRTPSLSEPDSARSAPPGPSQAAKGNSPKAPCASQVPQAPSTSLAEEP